MAGQDTDTLVPTPLNTLNLEGGRMMIQIERCLCDSVWLLPPPPYPRVDLKKHMSGRTRFLLQLTHIICVILDVCFNFSEPYYLNCKYKLPYLLVGLL